MTTIPVPDEDDAAKQTDFHARVLAEVLREEGFSRKGRTLRRVLREAEGVQVVHLQGTGRFCVNIGVYFLPLARLLKPITRNSIVALENARAWDGHVRCRIDKVLPNAREPWWLSSMQHGSDLWFEIGRTKDEQRALASILERVASEYLLPWLRRNQSLEAVVAPPDPVDAQDDVVAMAAFVALGQRERAKALFVPERYKKREREKIERLLAG